LLAVKIVQPENSNQVAGAQLQVLNACTLWPHYSLVCMNRFFHRHDPNSSCALGQLRAWCILV
jgi:hypothetical protein